MNKTILILIIAVILIVLAGGYFIFYGGNQGSPYSANTKNTNNSPAATPSTSLGQTNQPANSSSSVSIKNFAFNPSPIAVKVGTTVTWTNDDTVPHQIKSATFNSAVLDNGQNFQFTFSVAGEYNYSCAIHPSMLGKIIVTQ